jgi:hypothetical protein
MTPEEREVGRNLLAKVGPLRCVGQITEMLTPPLCTNALGATIKNKAQGNTSFGYFEDDDPAEQNFLELILWLLNNAEELVNGAPK